MIDEEDLDRAELCHEALFYHQVLEELLDHFLQLLYAKNNCYFPQPKALRRIYRPFPAQARALS